MRRLGAVFKSAGLILALCALIVYSDAAIAGARRGLALCGTVIIPSLFPFFILSSLMRSEGLTDALANRSAGVMSRLFGVSGEGAAAFILGVTGGYPVGAGAVAGLVRDGKIDKAEGERLLPFCNASGPAFIVGAAGAGVFGDYKIGLLLYLSHVLAQVCVGLIFRKSGGGTPSRLPPAKISRSGGLTQAVRGAVSAILNVCGFVVCFAVVIDTLERAGAFSFLAGEMAYRTGLGLRFTKALLAGLLELGCGVSSLRGMAPTGANLALAAFLIGWGGLSVHFQTAAVIDGTGMKAARHTVGRLMCGAFSAVFILLLTLPRT